MGTAYYLFVIMLPGQAGTGTHVTVDRIDTSLDDCIKAAHVDCDSGHLTAMPPEGEVGQHSQHSQQLAQQEPVCRLRITTL
jgi:hypothetical protein